ncbi:MAG: hypothetical protein ACW98U_13615 [Candidatus Thorarchaeota archaeon]
MIRAVVLDMDGVIRHLDKETAEKAAGSIGFTYQELMTCSGTTIRLLSYSVEGRRERIGGTRFSLLILDSKGSHRMFYGVTFLRNPILTVM